MRPHRWQPTRLPHPWDSPGKNTGVGCHFLLLFMKLKSESEVAQSCPTLSDPIDCSPQAPPSMGFSRQEYWSGVPSPSPLQGIHEVKIIFIIMLWCYFPFSLSFSHEYEWSLLMSVIVQPIKCRSRSESSCLLLREMLPPWLRGKKNPPATQEMKVRSLGREDFLEKEMTTHSSILAWRIP